MTKTEKLKEAMDCMRRGYAIEVTEDGGYHKSIAYIGNSANPNDKRKYIFWNSYGSSANRISLKDLRWLFKNIFKNSSYDFEKVLDNYN